MVNSDYSFFFVPISIYKYNKYKLVVPLKLNIVLFWVDDDFLEETEFLGGSIGP